MARLIKADGTETEVSPKGKKWTLVELQMLVGGYIELMPGVGRKFRMIMDEEARLKGKSLNKKASDLVLQALGNQPLRYVPMILGDVLILDPKEKM